MEAVWQNIYLLLLFLFLIKGHLGKKTVIFFIFK